MSRRALRVTLAVALVVTVVSVAQAGVAAPPGSVAISPIGTYATGLPFDGDYGAAEIPAYDPETRRVFVVNGQQKQIDVLDISVPSAPAKVGSIPLELRPNSVAAHEGLVAVALEADSKTDPGSVVFYPAGCQQPSACEPLNDVEVGSLPDMLTFSPNGQYVLVANEGEPEGDVDPPGTVSIIDLRQGVERARVRTVGFESLDGKPVPAGALLQPGKEPSVDFEPEYVTFSTNSRRAWVALQEANAIAEIDVAGARLVTVWGLGFKDHGVERNSLDASDREATGNRGVINMCAWENVYGMYQPDAIAAYQVRNRFFVVSANEGDARSADEARVGASALNAGFVGSPFDATLRNNRNLGRLTINRSLGKNAQGTYERLFAYGARSLSIWSETGAQVYDSGNDLERIVGSFGAQESRDPYRDPLVLDGPSVPEATSRGCPLTEAVSTDVPSATTPANANHEEGPSFDNRSDNKGPEPEAVAVGRVRGTTYAFVGLERVGGIAVYDVSDPESPSFVQYVNPRNFAAQYVIDGDETTGDWQEAGDLGPEGVVFVPGGDTPGGVPLLIVANEVSGTTTIYAVQPR